MSLKKVRKGRKSVTYYLNMAIYHIIGEKIRLNEDLGKSFPDSSVFFLANFTFFYLFKKFAKFGKKDHQFSVLFLNLNIADSWKAGIPYRCPQSSIDELWHSQNGIFDFIHFYSSFINLLSRVCLFSFDLYWLV